MQMGSDADNDCLCEFSRGRSCQIKLERSIESREFTRPSAIRKSEQSSMASNFPAAALATMTQPGYWFGARLVKQRDAIQRIVKSEAKVCILTDFWLHSPCHGSGVGCRTDGSTALNKPERHILRNLADLSRFSQVVPQLFSQYSRRWNKEAAIDGLVGHVHALVIGILGLQPPGNLPGRPVQGSVYPQPCSATCGSWQDGRSWAVEGSVHSPHALDRRDGRHGV